MPPKREDMVNPRTGLGYVAKLNDELIDKAYELAREGQYNNVIMALLGVSQSAWYRWLREGQRLLEDENYEPDKPYTEEMKRLMARLYLMLEKGQAEAEQKAVQLIQVNAMTDWKAAAWYLERKYRSRWGRVYVEEKERTPSKLDEFLEGMRQNTQLSEEDKARIEAEMAESDQ